MFQICTNKGPDCAPLTQMELAALFQEESDAFLSAHSDMCAVRFIYAPIRSVEEEVVEEYLSLAGQLVESFPDFFVGFDLVGQEDLGRPLVDFADQLVEAKEGNPNLTYFFHAGTECPSKKKLSTTFFQINPNGFFFGHCLFSIFKWLIVTAIASNVHHVPHLL